MITVADMTIQGTLATLVCSVDAAQYGVVRGVLDHNLGDTLPPAPAAPSPPPHQQVPQPLHLNHATNNYIIALV